MTLTTHWVSNQVVIKSGTLLWISNVEWLKAGMSTKMTLRRPKGFHGLVHLNVWMFFVHETSADGALTPIDFLPRAVLMN